MVDRRNTPGEFVLRWADAHATAYCVLSVLAVGRVALFLNMQQGFGMHVLLLVAHVVIANVALSWILLTPHPASSRLVLALAGIGTSVLVIVGLAGTWLPSPSGPTPIVLLMSVASGSLIGIALVYVRGTVSTTASAIHVVAAVLFTVALASFFIETAEPIQLMLGGLQLVAVHAVWMSAMYTFFALVLSSRKAGPVRRTTLDDA
ncbi:MAG: hypothetical protein IBX63_10420 [Coriobacteriia bacterium]|nr:hypothetical protein [Coriobacteriia bacterium]